MLDAWHRCEETRREDLLYRALWERVTSWRALSSELARTPRIAGRARIERILRQFEAGATSPLEVLARTHVFVGAEFRECEWQAPIDASGMKVADMLHRRARLVVEFDGWAYHSARERAARDRQRDIELAAAGFVTIRLGFTDLRDRSQWCRDRVLEIIARRTSSAY